MTAKIGGVEHQHDGVRQVDSSHLAAQNRDRDALVLGFRVQAVDARQVDQCDTLAVLQRDVSGEVFDRDAGEVSYLAVKARKLVEQRSFAAIGWPYESDRADRLLNPFQYPCAEGRAAALARRHQACSCAEGIRTMMCREVARRIATSVPSSR